MLRVIRGGYWLVGRARRTMLVQGRKSIMSPTLDSALGSESYADESEEPKMDEKER